jgi:LacI family transcriptional regulator
LLCNSDEELEKERRYLDIAVEEQVAGVVLSPTGVDTDVTALRRRGTPVVAVDRPLAGADQVLVDSRAAAREATAHLQAAGYRRIGCVTGPAGIATADQRLAGWRDATGAAQGLARNAEYRADGAHRAAAELLAGPDPVDALLVGNSAQAVGVLEAIRESGRRVGADVGIVAFDDAPWTTLIDPPLTVVAQPAYEMGAAAARMLLDRIADGGHAPVTRTLAARLVERGSSRR